MIKMRQNKLLSALLFFCILGILIAFNNCGQPGSIELKATGPAEKAINDQIANDLDDVTDSIPTETTTTGNSTSSDPIITIQPITYLSKSTSIEIKAGVNNQIDVLIVIDNSGSMSYEQKNMAERFSNFTDQLNGLDWRLGVITTDISADAELKDGRLIEFTSMSKTKFLDSSMDPVKVKSAFAETIQRPEVGSSREQGIAASFRAIERSKSTNNTDLGNQQFFRANSTLNIIIVTDANETPFKSGRTFRNDPQNLLAKIKEYWPQKTAIIHSIVVKTDDKSCLAINGNESYGKTYEQAALLTNGIIGSVCETDYSDQLKIMGQATRETVNTITLDCAPVDANQDGILDVVVTNPDQAIVSSGYEIKGAQVVFTQALPIGITKINYICESMPIQM